MNIREKIWNIDLVLEDIKKEPQTYETILKNETSSTLNSLLRKKLNKLCAEGKLCKAIIPATRMGKVIFFVLPKDYYILMLIDRFGVEVWYFKEYKKENKLMISVPEGFKLRGSMWEQQYDLKFFEGKVVKFI
jgi:hypothetical protein